MANIDNISTGSSVFASIQNFFSSLAESFEMSRRFHATYRELNMLSARELADLGISRGEIHRIAYDAVYGTHTSEYRRG